MRSSISSNSFWAPHLPAQPQGAEQFGQRIRVEDPTAQDTVDEALQGIRTETVLFGDDGQFPGVLLRLEALVTLADGLLVQPLAFREGVDVFDHVLALVEELCIAGQQADELLTAYLLLPGRLAGEAGDEFHDVVIVDERRVEQHELEIELPDGVVGVWRLLLPGFELLGNIEIDAPEGAQVIFRQQFINGLAQFRIEIGVLVELGTDALHFPEAVDEGGAGLVTLEAGDFPGPAVHALGLHEVSPGSRIKHYDGLIKGAQEAYSEYLEKSKELDNLDNIVDRI